MASTTVVVGICGGIAAYKCADLVRLLVKDGHTVHVILTKGAEQFVTPLTLQTLSGNPVHRDLFDLAEEQWSPPSPTLPPIGGREGWGGTGQWVPCRHIALADCAQCILVAPATANILAKVAHGLCDDLLTTVICAMKAPVAFAPSMNVHMWENPITQANIARLKECGYHIIPPASGDLACGYEGMGRLPEPATLVAAVKKICAR